MTLGQAKEQHRYPIFRYKVILNLTKSYNIG